MNTSERYHQPILEALCAFIRDRTQQPVAADTAAKARGAAPVQHQLQDDVSPPAADVQAALTVIGRRKVEDDEVNLSGAHIPKAYLAKADLTGVDLTDADLRGADLRDADLRDADLRGAILTHAVLSGADLTDAKVLTQEQLNDACGTDVKGLDSLDPPLTIKIKPCPEQR